VTSFNIYWGKEPYGTDTSTIIGTNSFDPPNCTSGDGIHYLRARPIDNIGNPGPWTTIMTYRFDDNGPTDSITAELID